MDKKLEKIADSIQEDIKKNANKPSGVPVGYIQKKTIVKSEMRRQITEYVKDHLDELLERMKDKAMGCAIIDKKDDTGERIYDLPPDPKACKLLFEYAIGKAIQPVMESDEDGNRIARPLTEEQIERVLDRLAKRTKEDGDESNG